MKLCNRDIGISHFFSSREWGKEKNRVKAKVDFKENSWFLLIEGSFCCVIFLNMGFEIMGFWRIECCFCNWMVSETLFFNSRIQWRTISFYSELVKLQIASIPQKSQWNLLFMSISVLNDPRNRSKWWKFHKLDVFSIQAFKSFSKSH